MICLRAIGEKSLKLLQVTWSGKTFLKKWLRLEDSNELGGAESSSRRDRLVQRPLRESLVSFRNTQKASEAGAWRVEGQPRAFLIRPDAEEAVTGPLFEPAMALVSWTPCSPGLGICFFLSHWPHPHDSSAFPSASLSVHFCMSVSTSACWGVTISETWFWWMGCQARSVITVSPGPASLAWTLGPSIVTRLSPPRAWQCTLKGSVVSGHTSLNMPSLIWRMLSWLLPSGSDCVLGQI